MKRIQHHFQLFAKEVRPKRKYPVYSYTPKPEPKEGVGEPVTKYFVPERMPKAETLCYDSRGVADCGYNARGTFLSKKDGSLVYTPLNRDRRFLNHKPITSGWVFRTKVFPIGRA